MSPKRLGLIAAVISAVTFGLIPLFIVPIKDYDVSLDTVLFYRFIIGALLIGGYAVLIKKENLFIRWAHLPKLLILGLLYAASAEFLFMGYDLLSPGVASTILFTYPVILALISWIFFKEKISGITWIALLITFGGIAALSITDYPFRIHWGGLGITLLSALSYALYMLFVKRGNLGLKDMSLTTYSMFFSGIFYLIKVVWTGGSLTLPSVELLGHIALFSFTTTVLSVATLIYALRTIGTTSTSILGALEPLVAVAVSVLLFHEMLTFNLVIGVVLILIGVCLNIITERKV